ncbi:MAG: AAA family ATPase [Syntrophorhabdaceae bacterium]|nr:AAA family ATPase [Syntrophorhabdaceae bacterium]
MYTDYWGLKKPPFDNVPDPSMYVDSHLSVENTVAETLFAIEEGNECLTVIVGDVGLGKTLSLRLILDSLDQSKYKIAFVTNPDMSFVQILREIIGQLTGKECEIRGRTGLLEIFNKLLFETADEGRKVLVFIDEANAISPVNLESLRLLTNMQDDTRNLFTIVLAGQMELAKRLEHPKRANLFQRIGTYNRIEKMDSEELVRNYVDTRLGLAGAERSIFTDDAIHKLYQHSEGGVPRLVNKIAKLCLKAGETNNFKMINGDVVQQIGQRFARMTGPAVQKRTLSEKSKKTGGEPVSGKPAPKKKAAGAKKVTAPPPPPPSVLEEKPVFAPPPPPPSILEEKPVFVPPPQAEEQPSIALPAEEIPIAAAEPIVSEVLPEIQAAVPQPPEVEEAVPENVQEEVPAEENLILAPLSPAPEPTFLPESPPAPAEENPILAPLPPLEPPATGSVRLIVEAPEEPVPEPEPDVAFITGCKIKIESPPQIFEQTASAGLDQKRKIAGVLAAQTLEKNPQLTASPTVDPVAVWSEILTVIMERLEAA